ncbi:SemiSWEET family transporter [Patescibacteria group bacterium]
MEFAEFQNFGWNTLTFSFLATILFGVLGALGLVDQIKKIWRNRSGESASVTFAIIFVAFFIASFIYGIDKHSLALILQGSIFRTVFFPPILYGLWRFKGYTLFEKIVAFLCSSAIVYMLTLDDLKIKGYIFLGLGLLGVLATLKQAWEIWKTKSSGVVSIKLMLIIHASSDFWLIYGIALRDHMIKYMSLGYFIANTLVIVFWFKYRTKSPVATIPNNISL